MAFQKRNFLQNIAVIRNEETTLGADCRFGSAILPHNSFAPFSSEPLLRGVGGDVTVLTSADFDENLRIAVVCLT
jgi:hypothetical protein